MSSISAATSAPTPLVLPLRQAIMWVVGTLLVAFAAYYVIGVEQGAVSLFGGNEERARVPPRRAALPRLPLPLTAATGLTTAWKRN